MILLSFALAALAQTTAPSVPSATGSTPEKPKMVCKSERFVGSLVPKRRCRTKEQWDAEAQATQRQLSEQGRYSRATTR